LGKFNLYNVAAQSGSWMARLNGTAIGSVLANTVQWSQHTPTLGCRPASLYTYEQPNNFSGDIAELMIFDRVLNTGERAAVNTYLTTKYNLGSADTTVPSTPAALTPSGITPTSITLSWAASTDNVGVTGYDIYRDGLYIGSSSTTSFSIVRLTPNTTYSFTVKAKDGAGNSSASSAALSVRSGDTISPASVSAVTASNITATSVTLSWQGSSDNYGVTGYTIYRDGVAVGSSETTSFVLNGLTAGTSYSLTVKAYDAAGNLSAGSATVAVRTAPYQPNGLSATSVTAGSFTLSWTAEADNPEVIGYDVYKNGMWVELVSGATYTLTGLTASTTYTVTVLARDAAGNVSAWRH
jgi:chitinase